MAKKHILPHGDSWIVVIPKIDERIIMTEDEYQEIWNLHPQKRPKGNMFGKEITFPRWMQHMDKHTSLLEWTRKHKTYQPIHISKKL